MFTKKYVVLLLVLLFGVLGIGNVLGQNQPRITEFRITPINGSRLVRQPNSDYPVQYTNNSLLFEVWATGGTVRFTSQYLNIGENYEAFGEFAGPVYSTPITTLWSGEEPVEFCAENRGDGGWENADRACTTIVVYIGHQCVEYARGGFGCAYEFEDYGPLTYYRPGEPQREAPALEYCANALTPIIEVGQRGRVSFTNGDPTGLYDRPQGEVILRLPEGTEFAVIGGPVCTVARNGHLWWSQLQLDDGTTGWSAYGYIGTPYWIELAPSAAPVVAGNVLVPVRFDPWDTTYVLEVNPRTCAIVNGAEIIALELVRFDSFVGQLDWGDVLSLRQSASEYFSVNSGQTEQFRLRVEELATEQSSCYSVYYLVGTHAMDTSGLGNVVFGYAMEEMPWLIEELIADWKQGANVQSQRWYFDFPDDRQQRELGRRVAESIESAREVSAALVSELAEEVDLH